MNHNLKHSTCSIHSWKDHISILLIETSSVASSVREFKFYSDGILKPDKLVPDLNFGPSRTVLLFI